jgi:SLOG cluster2
MISATTRQVLKDIVIGLSLSENTADMSIRGLPSDQVNKLVLRFSQTFLSHGACLVFGHDWRPDGVMEAVYDIAARYTSLSEETSFQSPRLRNIVPWPSHPTLSRSEQDSLSPMLKIELCSLPAGISETPPIDISQTDWKTYLRARALTHARRTLDELSRVRICAGGRTKGSSGRYLGIVEEA